MNCCIECFRDTEIRAIIKSYGQKGVCDFCTSKDVFVCDADDPSNPISEMIVDLMQIYSISDVAEAKPLKVAFRDDWDIFSAETETILILTKRLCASVYSGDADIFTKNVIIKQTVDNEFLRDYGVVRGHSWDEFSEALKRENRFHCGMFNGDQFALFLDMFKKDYPIGTRMYRARVSADKSGFSENDMGIPPYGRRIAGRINPEGIGVLYLSSDELTVLNEVRASTFDFITIGTFQAVRDVKIADLSGIGKTSPFSFDIDLEKFAANRKVFQELATEIAKPLRRNDSSLEYLPTQYIAEFIKSQNYDGVEYESTIIKGGRNLAAFDENTFRCIDTKTIEISEIKYVTEPKLV